MSVAERKKQAKMAILLVQALENRDISHLVRQESQSDTDSDGIVGQYVKLSEKMSEIVEGSVFGYTIMTFIFIASAMVGLQTYEFNAKVKGTSGLSHLDYNSCGFCFYLSTPPRRHHLESTTGRLHLCFCTPGFFPRRPLSWILPTTSSFLLPPLLSPPRRHTFWIQLTPLY
jgi:hypothetical protein